MSQMTYSIDDAKIAAILATLHGEADRSDGGEIARACGIEQARGPLESKERADLFENVYMPVSPEAGRFLYMLALGRGAKQIVEFGTSYGISAIYFAAALRDQGAGRLITAELSARKLRRAQAHIAEAGLSDYVEFREGDALNTLRGLEGPVDFLFLDGWKKLYLPVLELIEPVLAPGAFVVADDLDLFKEDLKPYLEYVRDPGNGYLSLTIPLGDGVEWSIRGMARHA